MNRDKAKPSALRLLILAPSNISGQTEYGPARLSPIPALLEAITNSKPSRDIKSYAGYTSHPALRLTTKYYNVDVSIWCDEVSISSSKKTPPQRKDRETEVQLSEKLDDGFTADDPEQQDDDGDDDAAAAATTATLEDWKSQMLSSAASEVRAAIGGIVLVLPLERPSHATSMSLDSYLPLIEAVHELREAAEDDSNGRDVAAVILLQAMLPREAGRAQDLERQLEKLEDRCLSERGILGWDFVSWDGVVPSSSGDDDKDVKNVFGEKVGVQRVLEVLEAVDWTARPDTDDLRGLDGVEDDLDEEEQDTVDPMGNERFRGLDDELQQEMMGLKLSMLDRQAASDEDGFVPDGEGEDMSIEQMQGLMQRVVAIRAAGSEMSTAERERFAKREINKIMKDLG